MRLVLFSLDQQREIYRTDNFEPADFSRVSQALNRLELGTVDYEVLKNRRGHIDLISDLINEASKDGRSEAVVFLGPKPWYFDKVQRSALPSGLRMTRHFFTSSSDPSWRARPFPTL